MDNKRSINSYQKMTVIVLIVLVVVMGATYAWLTITLTSTKSNDVVVGNLSLKIDDDLKDGIHLENAIPVSDTVGLSYEPYYFSLTNNGSIESNYTIYLDDGSIDSGITRMNDEYLKYSLEKNGTGSESKFLKSIKTEQGRILDSGILKVGETNEYNFRLWIDHNVENDVMTTVFSGKIRVEAEQIKE